MSLAGADLPPVLGPIIMQVPGLMSKWRELPVAPTKRSHFLRGATAVVERWEEDVAKSHFVLQKLF
jgi:hypothetical protein